MVRHYCVLTFVACAVGCSGAAPTTPTPPATPAVLPRPVPSQPSPSPSGNFVLTGMVTDADTSAPIPGATVSINGRYASATDGAGNYSVRGDLDMGGGGDFTYTSVSGYVSDYHYIRGTSQNIRMHRIQRITVGTSSTITVTPQDSLCVNNVQDTPGLGPDYVCRSVRVTASGEGLMIVEAVSIGDGVHPPLEIEVNGDPVNWQQPLPNPTSVQVSAGIEVVVNVELPAGSPVSQSFTLRTSMSKP